MRETTLAFKHAGKIRCFPTKKGSASLSGQAPLKKNYKQLKNINSGYKSKKKSEKEEDMSFKVELTCPWKRKINLRTTPLLLA